MQVYSVTVPLEQSTQVLSRPSSLDMLSRSGGCIGCLLGMLLVRCTIAGNPLVPNVGMADPHLRVSSTFPRFLLFATHDFSPNNTGAPIRIFLASLNIVCTCAGFLMKDWWVWTSNDLVHWIKSAVIAPSSQFLSWDTNANECWATDGCELQCNLYPVD